MQLDSLAKENSALRAKLSSLEARMAELENGVKRNSKVKIVRTKTSKFRICRGNRITDFECNAGTAF